MKGQRPSETELLLKIIDEGYNRKSWHGTNLRGSVRGLTVKEASWRPTPERHNIWEIVVHAAYWKYIVRRRLCGEKKGSFPLDGSNWFARPETAGDKAWKHDVALLDKQHELLRDAVGLVAPKKLLYAPSKSSVDNLTLLVGIAMHDVYHAGQIQLLKRLQRQKKRAGVRGRPTPDS